MKARIIISAIALFIISSMIMAQTTSMAAVNSNNQPQGQVVDPNAGTGIRKSTTRKSEVPIFNIVSNDLVNLEFQSHSDDTSIYITDGNDLYFEAGLMVNESTNISIPTSYLPKGNYYVIVENEAGCFYEELSVY